MKIKTNIYNLFLIALIAGCALSCKKDKNPFPTFPKVEGAALTTVIPLPFYDSLNYGSTVPTFGIPPGWLEAFVTGSKEDRGWAYRPNYGITAAATDGAIVCSAFGGNVGTDNVYLIKGPFNLSTYSSLTLLFDLHMEYDIDPGSLTFKYSTNYSGSGNPEASGVTWTPINEINSQLPVTATQGYTGFSSTFSIPANNVFIGLHWSGGMNIKSKRWRLDNFNLKGI